MWIFRKAIEFSETEPNLRKALKKYPNGMKAWVDYVDKPSREFVIDSNILIGSVFPNKTIIRENTIPSRDSFGNIVPLEVSMDFEVFTPNGTRWIMDVENHCQSPARHLLDRFRIYGRHKNKNGFCKDNEFYQPNCIGELHIFPVDMVAYYCSVNICRDVVDYCRSTSDEYKTVYVNDPGVITIDLHKFGRYEEQSSKYLNGKKIWDFPIIEYII